MKRKSLKPWIFLLVAPIVAIFGLAILQFAVHFIAPDGGAIVNLVNIVSLLVGVVSAIALLGIPVWIIMLVLAISHNNDLDRALAMQQSAPQAMPAQASSPYYQMQQMTGQAQPTPYYPTQPAIPAQPQQPVSPSPNGPQQPPIG